MNRLKVKGRRKLYDANMSGKKNKKLKTVLTETISDKAVFRTRKSGIKMGIT